MFRRLNSEIQVFLARDPAARSRLEVLLCYPGLHAILFHRLAHWLWTKGFRLLARIVSQVSRFLTGIEIHPGARVGERFFIDHGSGVVIGETAEIGEDVLIYQGVTLGGTGKEKGGKRHPTIGDRVTVGVGAVVLGPITIGHDVRIGAGSVVVKPVPDNCTVVGVPGRIARMEGRKLTDDELLAHGNLPDPEVQLIREMQERVSELAERLRVLEKRMRDESVNG
ncbi:MAG: serine O-acetyltransferase [Nitrospirae bacterium]|nr:serine O-acetyltransferase [Nitrospirota bacterium]MBI3392493.1 serine O-acetyltransferase [Nitrospirota bacterium]